MLNNKFDYFEMIHINLITIVIKYITFGIEHYIYISLVFFSKRLKKHKNIIFRYLHTTFFDIKIKKL
jgi:hypothetical protein